MTETTVGREVIQVVEIQQPLCSRTFGVSPCTATGTVDTKCYNTRGTCQDTANYALGTALSLYFTKGGVADREVSGVPYAIPSLVSVNTSPTKINIAGINPDAQGLGNRALCTIRFKDHPHTDRRVDPYQSGRTFDPLTRGSFWTKWLVRNKYRQNVVIKVYEGYAGQALSAMNVRTYFLQSVTPPDSNGNVTIQGKDVLARIEERKSKAPILSPGVLYVDITDTATSIEVANAVEADYPATGTIRINDELMTYSARATSTNGITFTITARGTDGTSADSHGVDDAVQECLRYTTQAVDTILEDLLTTYGGVSSSYLDTTAWATEVGDYLVSYLLTTVITEPTSVSELISEIQVQASCYIWWDERAAKVKLKAIRGVDVVPPTITEETHILEGSFKLTEKPRERASQVWIYYNARDYSKGVKDVKRYASQVVVADLESETDELYGEASVKTIFARWLPNSALANTTGSKIITRYVDIPTQVKFSLDAKDRNDYWVGDDLKISHHLDVDQYGVGQLRTWTIVSAEETKPGEVVEYTAEDTTLYGVISYVMASGAADYTGTASDPAKNCYIGDSAGLLSDGEPAGRIN